MSFAAGVNLFFGCIGSFVVACAGALRNDAAFEVGTGGMLKYCAIFLDLLLMDRYNVKLIIIVSVKEDGKFFCILFYIHNIRQYF